jgi:hypothetical protein
MGNNFSVSATRGCGSSIALCEGVCVALMSPLARCGGGLQPTKHQTAAAAASAAALPSYQLQTTYRRESRAYAFGSRRIDTKRCVHGKQNKQTLRGTAAAGAGVAAYRSAGKGDQGCCLSFPPGVAGRPTKANRFGPAHVSRCRTGGWPDCPAPLPSSPCSPTLARPLLDGEPFPSRGALLSAFMDPLPFHALLLRLLDCCP